MNSDNFGAELRFKTFPHLVGSVEERARNTGLEVCSKQLETKLVGILMPTAQAHNASHTSHQATDQLQSFCTDENLTSLT